MQPKYLNSGDYKENLRALFFCLKLKNLGHCTHKQIHCPSGKQQIPSTVVWVQFSKYNWIHSYELQCVKNTKCRLKKLFLENKFNNICNYIIYQAFFYYAKNMEKSINAAVWIQSVKKDMSENCIPLYFSWINICIYLYTSNFKKFRICFGARFAAKVIIPVSWKTVTYND